MSFLTNKLCCSCVSSATPSHQIIFTAIDSNIDPPWKAEKPPLLSFKLQRIMFCHALNKKERMPKHVKILQEEKHKHYGSTQQKHSHDMEYSRYEWFNTHFAPLKILKMHWGVKTKCTSSYGTSFAAFTETFLHQKITLLKLSYLWKESHLQQVLFAFYCLFLKYLSWKGGIWWPC